MLSCKLLYFAFSFDINDQPYPTNINDQPYPPKRNAL